MFLVPNCCTLHFFILNLNFQISFQYDNSFNSLSVASFDSSLMSTLTLSANSFISDLFLFHKPFTTT